jgi:anhydro-N-acetylmuramic acid kinase
MSGTSVDGVDAALAEVSGDRARVVAHVHHGFGAELRDELLRLNAQCDDELHRAAVAAQHLARAYADTVADLLRHQSVDAEQIVAIGAHGQTVRHRPESGYTIQLNAPAVLAELTGIDVIADFRSRDIAAGGQGAPLVPAFHEAMFRHRQARAVVNIGGIANVTALPAQWAEQPVIGFDCGPGNVLMDLWSAQILGEPYDENGRWAASGTVNSELLDRLLAEPYLALPPPKSTGRELFNMAWLNSKLVHTGVAPQSVAATLAEFTARTIAAAIDQHAADAAEVIVCGGGALNSHLMRRLAACCGGCRVLSSAELGIDPSQVEALAFAWLAHRFLAGAPGNLPAVTGARGPRILGALYPK